MSDESDIKIFPIFFSMFKHVVPLCAVEICHKASAS